jgi:DegV family protein with EDD domain
VAADGALEGARGNSGAIFAQFLHGLAGGMAPHQQVDGVQFAVAAGLGTESAYSALQEPREGTILSVLRAWSHELTRRAHEDEFVEMMHGGLVEARAALAETEHQLKVLALNHVVDAGGQGFVYFLEGLHESLRGRSPQWAPAEASPRGIPPFSPGHDEVDDRYRYCSEVLLAPDDGRVLSRDAVMAAVGGLGDSLVVAGGERRLRVHLHTNEPQRFIAAVASLGVLERSKIDDMVLQQLAGRESTVALVTDSTTDMPEEDAFKLGVVTVPLTLVLGDEEYLDGVDITAEGFVRRVSDSSLAPHSSQPAASDFAETYRRLLDYHDGVLSVHIAGAMSGTVQAARAAAREVDPERVRVVDTRSVSVGSGLVLEAAGEAVAGGAGLDEVAAAAEQAARDVRVFGAPASLDFAVRGGRVSPRMARTLKRLHLAPIIVFDETGRAGKGGAALGFDRALDAIVKRAVRYARGAPARAMVVHSGDPASAAHVAARLQAALGGDVPVVRAGAVLTSHVGLGSVTVAIRRLPG